MEIVYFLLSVGAIYSLIPVMVILILIAAGAGLSRNQNILELLGIGSLFGLGGTVGQTPTGRGLRKGFASSSAGAGSRAKKTRVIRSITDLFDSDKNPKTIKDPKDIKLNAEAAIKADLLHGSGPKGSPYSEYAGPPAPAGHLDPFIKSAVGGSLQSKAEMRLKAQQAAARAAKIQPPPSSPTSRKSTSPFVHGATGDLSGRGTPSSTSRTTTKLTESQSELYSSEHPETFIHGATGELKMSDRAKRVEARAQKLKSFTTTYVTPYTKAIASSWTLEQFFLSPLIIVYAGLYATVYVGSKAVQRAWNYWYYPDERSHLVRRMLSPNRSRYKKMLKNQLAFNRINNKEIRGFLKEKMRGEFLVRAAVHSDNPNEKRLRVLSTGIAAQSILWIRGSLDMRRNMGTPSSTVQRRAQLQLTYDYMMNRSSQEGVYHEKYKKEFQRIFDISSRLASAIPQKNSRSNYNWLKIPERTSHSYYSWLKELHNGMMNYHSTYSTILATIAEESKGTRYGVEESELVMALFRSSQGKKIVKANFAFLGLRSIDPDKRNSIANERTYIKKMFREGAIKIKTVGLKRYYSLNTPPPPPPSLQGAIHRIPPTISASQTKEDVASAVGLAVGVAGIANIAGSRSANSTAAASAGIPSGLITKTQASQLQANGIPSYADQSGASYLGPGIYRDYNGNLYYINSLDQYSSIRWASTQKSDLSKSKDIKSPSSETPSTKQNQSAPDESVKYADEKQVLTPAARSWIFRVNERLDNMSSQIDNIQNQIKKGTTGSSNQLDQLQTQYSLLLSIKQQLINAKTSTAESSAIQRAATWLSQNPT